MYTCFYISFITFSFIYTYYFIVLVNKYLLTVLKYLKVPLFWVSANTKSTKQSKLSHGVTWDSRVMRCFCIAIICFSKFAEKYLQKNILSMRSICFDTPSLNRRWFFFELNEYYPQICHQPLEFSSESGPFWLFHQWRYFYGVTGSQSGKIFHLEPKNPKWWEVMWADFHHFSKCFARILKIT